MSMRSLVKRTFRRFGYSLRRFNPLSSEAIRLGSMLKAHEVNLVFDIGANAGQFAQSLRELGYRGRIVSFEPQSEAREQLERAADCRSALESRAKGGNRSRRWRNRVELGGQLYKQLLITDAQSHLRLGPDSRYFRTERVPLRRLDALGASYLQADSKLFIKADVQGYEREVLKGRPVCGAAW